MAGANKREIVACSLVLKGEMGLGSRGKDVWVKLRLKKKEKSVCIEASGHW